jgi:RimK family alpha-L-glutamate ligase
MAARPARSGEHPWRTDLPYGFLRGPYFTAAPIGVDSDAPTASGPHDSDMGLAGTSLREPRVARDCEPEGRLIAIVGGRQETNLALATAWQSHGLPAALVSPREAATLLRPGDTALVRLDVLPTLDGIQDGLDEVGDVARRGVRVLNGRRAIVAAHDKLRTAACLMTARLPHPKTVHLPRENAPLGLRPPFVLKPRFGSWGLDVFLCETEDSFKIVLRQIRDRPWFLRHGALLQEVVPSTGRDVRILVAGGRVVGAIQRVASPGEWRTNVSRGAARVPVTPTPEACRLAIAAAAAIGGDFVGVDLLPLEASYVVIELNGAVDFNNKYDLDGHDVYMQIATALALPLATLARS